MCQTTQDWANGHSKRSWAIATSTSLDCDMDKVELSLTILQVLAAYHDFIAVVS